MEIIFVLYIIFTAVVLNSMTLFKALSITPASAFFMGVVHWPGDYFYYLSQFAQGRYFWFSGYDLFTSDFPQKTYVGWVNIFFGRIMHLFGISHLSAYQIAIMLFASTYLSFSYLLIREIFPGKKWPQKSARAIAFFLLFFSNSFPNFILEKGRWTLSYFDYWYNNGVPFNRLGGVPHHLLSRSMISLGLVLAVWWWKNFSVISCQLSAIGRSDNWLAGNLQPENGKPNTDYRKLITRVILAISLVFGGLILASTEPVHWLLVCLTMGISSIVLFWQFLGGFGRVRMNDLRGLSKIIKIFLPPVLFFLGGLPIAVYLKKIFTIAPYVQLFNWESYQQLVLSPKIFFLGNGLVSVLAVFGMIIFLKRLSIPKLIAVVFPLISIGLFFSPLPHLVKIVNVRFIPSSTTLFLSILTAQFLVFVIEKLKWRRLLSMVLVFMLLFLYIPLMTVQQKIRTKYDTYNSFFYVDKKVIDVYEYARKISTIDDTFLLIWPYDWSFPGMTARRAYTGHTLLTIDYNKKIEETNKFFYGQMNAQEMGKFLAEKRIDYLITFPWTANIDKVSNIEKLYDGGILAVYKVKSI